MNIRESTEFRCALCSKKFDKYASFKRHGYYCRSKPKLQRASRGKCCTLCALAKVRCDTRTPACSRCVAKNLKCQYGTRKGGSDVISSTPLVYVPPQDTISAAPEHDSEDMVPFQERPSVPTEQFNFGGIPDVSWSSIDENYAVSDDWNWDLLSAGAYTNPELQFLPVSPVPRYPTPERFAWKAPSMQFSSQLRLTIPKVPLFLGSLSSRMKFKSSMHVSGTILMRMFYSYTKMMLRPETFPPFVHPYCFPSDRDGTLEPIVNCMSLMQLFEAGNRNSRRMLWRTIRAEQIRLTAEHESYSKWELLAAMQALLVYVLLRLAEGETEWNDMDLPLVSSIRQMTKTLIETFYPDTDRFLDSSPSNDWKAWLFEESRKRTAIIFRILDAVLHLNTTVCTLPENFVLVPLPARKLLWEASTPETWRAELGRGQREEEEFGLRSDGELTRVRLGMGFALAEYGNDEAESVKRNWQDWCAGMDGFGSLIMIAASMLSF